MSPRPQSDWPEAIAEVTACHYDARAGRALAFGIPLRKHFRIAYNYRVGDDLLVGECYSEHAMPQGTLFPIRYDPDLPRQHHALDGTALSPRSARRAQLALGIAGSVVLSLAWLLLIRGCHQ